MQKLEVYFLFCRSVLSLSIHKYLCILNMFCLLKFNFVKSSKYNFCILAFRSDCGIDDIIL